MKTHFPLHWIGAFLLGFGFLGFVNVATGATRTVSVSGVRFEPPSLTVNVGDTVMFTGGGGDHTVTGRDLNVQPFCGTPRFSSCSVIFTNTGSFRYFCIPHEGLNMTGVVHVVTGETSPLTVVRHGQGVVLPDLNGQQLALGASYTITAQPAAGFRFSGWTGGVTSSVARLTFVMQSDLVLEANFVDVLKPAVTITAPRPNVRLTTNAVLFNGTARDNDSFLVEYRLQSSTGLTAFAPALGNTNWSVNLDGLPPGAYRFQVRARDGASNLSTEFIRNFQVLARLTVTVEDEDDGSVTRGFLGTTYRDVGRRLSLSALPRPGYLFAGWTGDLVSSANPLIFIIRSNVSVEANFVDNPFLPLKGGFSGLFNIDTPTNVVRHESSGAFGFNLTDHGRYTGVLQVSGKRRPFSGQFGLDGKATNSVTQPGTNALLLELMLDLAGGTERVMGRVINEAAGWTAGLFGDHAQVYRAPNASPYQGRYTLVFEGEEPAGFEQGLGYGTVVVNANGKLVFLGNLADGTPVSQGATVSKGGDWPLYLALYGGRGSMLSWVIVQTNPAPADSLYGEVSWIKPTLPGARLYAAGFTNLLDLEGSRYRPPGTNKVLQITNGTVTLIGGNLSQTFTNEVLLGANNRVTNVTTNQPLVMNLVLPTGLFSGSVTVMDGGARKKVLFKGAVLQHQNLGAGFFTGTNVTGTVEFEQLVP